MNFGIIDLFMILFVTMGPLKPAIVFVTLTTNTDSAFRRRVALRTVVTASIIALMFVFIGEFLLKAFHVSLPALQIAGGLILLLYALEMVLGSSKGDPASTEKPSENIGVFPLAMPLTATPQSLVAIMTITASKPGFSELTLIVGMILGLMALNFFFLIGSHKILGAIGPAALNVVARVVGLLLAALAIQLMIFGLTDLGVIPEQLPVS